MPVDSSPSLASKLIPLVGSLILTGIATYLLCTPPRLPTLTWTNLIVLTIAYVLLAAALHAGSTWLICRIFREQLEARPLPLIFGLWFSVAWLPLLTLLSKEQSIYAAAVPPLIAACAILFLSHKHRCPAHDAALSRHERGDAARTHPYPPRAATPELFRTEGSPAFFSKLYPAFLSSIALQGGIATLFTGHTIYAGLLIAASLIFPLWNLPRRTTPRSLKPKHALALSTLIVLIITAVPLMPFLRYHRISSGFSAFLHLPYANIVPNMPQIAQHQYAHGKGYSGFILFLPLKPHQRTIPHPPTDTPTPSTHHTEPKLIPFDGVYWYYKHPDTRPGRDAQHVHGEATKVDIHSTDYLPLAMEAHQFLGAPINTNSLHAIRVALRNADDRPGQISIELDLKNSASNLTESLGRVVLPSSTPRNIPLNRPAIDETLTFNLPRSLRDTAFDEIVVQIIPARERSLGGSHVAVQTFELLP